MTIELTPTTQTLSFPDGRLLRDGKQHRILSGSVHYFRVHPDQWGDRLQRIAAMGLNTVDTYVPWNFHRPRQNAGARFDGWCDVERFIRLAGEVGLDVIVRPGPYICAEWDNGGLPAWVTAMPGVQPRSSQPAYLAAVEEWFDELIPRLVELERRAGGPIVAFQIENEYGSYADDGAYLRWMHEALLTRGVTELLYTADGPTELMQDAGSIPGVLAAATLGSKAGEARDLLRGRRGDEPFLVAEFWNGWFDHWGENHHMRAPQSAAATAQDILDAAGSVSLYMAHGGTNFGLWAGANHDGERLQPTVTSYDSDAPVAENGALTEKYFAYRRLLLGSDAPELDLEEQPAVLSARTLPIDRAAALLPALRSASSGVSSPAPATFEQLGQASGLVLYRAEVLLPAGRHTLALHGAHDRALVYLDGVPVGVVENGDAEFAIDGERRVAGLEVLVENQGRINYGPLLGQGKGILGHVQVDRRLVLGWESIPLPLDEWDAGHLAALGTAAAAGTTAAPASSGIARAVLDVDEPVDAFLAFPGFGKGFVWVGDFLLGRYWEIGPQRTLYVPAPLLKRGRNVLTVLELERFGDAVEVREHAELGAAEEYVEEF